MDFYVPLNSSLLDEHGEQSDNGLYHNWLCIIKSEDEKTFDNVYVYHKEIYTGDAGWELPPESTWVGTEPCEQTAYHPVESSLCANTQELFALPSSNLIPKKKKAYRCDNFYSEEILKKLNGDNKALRKNFDNFRKTIDIQKYNLEELFFLFYNQGHLDTTPNSYEITQEDWERACFLNFIEDCIENPDNLTAPESSDYVKVTYPCIGHDKCLVWPDRMDEAGCDGETCSVMVNISKLCGIEESKKIKDKIDQKTLTSDEIETLSNILKKFTK